MRGDIIEKYPLLMYNIMSIYLVLDFLYFLHATSRYLDEFKRGWRKKDNGD